MQGIELVSANAKSYHKILQQNDDDWRVVVCRQQDKQFTSKAHMSFLDGNVPKEQGNLFL